MRIKYIIALLCLSTSVNSQSSNIELDESNSNQIHVRQSNFGNNSSVIKSTKSDSNFIDVNQVKDSFGTNISPDIQNPIIGYSSYLDTILKLFISIGTIIGMLWGGYKFIIRKNKK